MRFVVLFLITALFGFVIAAPPAVAQGTKLHIQKLCITYGDNISPSLKASMLTLLGEIPNLSVSHDTTACHFGRGVILAIGETPLAEALVPSDIIKTLTAEGFAHRFGYVGDDRVIAVRSKPNKSPGHRADVSIGFGLLSVLEHLGFALLHPLDPTVPSALRLDTARFDLYSSPKLPIRGIHLHTMHPIELANLLNGWGIEGPEDEAGFNQMLSEWRLFLTWMLANRLNRVQWVLLESPKWRAFSTSIERLSRLKQLVDIAHDFGIEVGVDAPIVMRQQNAFRLISRQGSLRDEMRQIEQRIDWLMAAGFDFLASENGTTEFTHPEPERMLAWMNTIASHLDTSHDGKRAYMKVHISSGQKSKKYVDPVDGGPLNINFLPDYADPKLAVMPHTVEYYGLSDPAPTYGNHSFSHIAAYMKKKPRRREVIWYPETAYWCSFDIDVPLFLPIYAERRFRDLRQIARWSHGRMDHIDGQVFFSSGWAWGYWLNDVVAARASWDPGQLEIADDTAFKSLLLSIFENLGETRYPLADLIAKTARKEADWLIKGANEDGAAFRPELTGQAYLQGEDTLDDLARVLSRVPKINLTGTQPDRVGLFYGRFDSVDILQKVDGLLSGMKQHLQKIADEFSPLSDDAPKAWHKYIRDLVLSARITSFRAAQVHALFRYALASRAAKGEMMTHYYAAMSRQALRDAKKVVDEAELLYRVDAERVAAWRANPTAYRFGYLWSVRHLYYFERDHRRLVGKKRNVCFGNVIDPFEVTFGYSGDSPHLAPLRRVINLVFDDGVVDRCFDISRQLKWKRQDNNPY